MTHSSVIAGLDPAIEENRADLLTAIPCDSGASLAAMDRRVKPGDDNEARALTRIDQASRLQIG